MTSHSELEISGNLFVHPFAELVAELELARVSGSLRVEEKKRKRIIYFRNGRVIFAASNSRSARLFQMLIDRRSFTKDDIAKIPSFQNDIDLADHLEEKGSLSKSARLKLFADQIEAIIVDILGWKSGEWSFSSLRRVRDGLEFDVDSRRILFGHARCLANENVLGRFRSLDERFHRSEVVESRLALDTDEAFVLSRIGDDPMTVGDLMSVSAVTESKALQVVYTLWLGGLLVRDDWKTAFSPEIIAAMRGAKLALKKEATLPIGKQPIAEPVTTAATPVETPPEPEIVITLDEYLDRVENAETYYDILGVDTKADLAAIKRAYFSLAKTFHPDKFHSEGPEVARRVQNAFTEMMQAHETLKNNENRDLYDYRIRKELVARDKREAQGSTGNASLQVEQASEQFERGFSLLMDGEIEAAEPFLARAVHYAPKVARYRAYYGKALATDPNKRHKAEAEMQAALKIDPNNPTFRILLAEFFIQFNLLKRAEGELKRLLAVFPSNREARDLLSSLQAKA